MTNFSDLNKVASTSYTSPAVDLIEFINEGILCESLDAQMDATIGNMTEVDLPLN